MDAEDIIHAIQEAERRKHAVSFSGKRRGFELKTKGEKWQLTLVNDPKSYKAEFEERFINNAAGFFKFKVDSPEAGKKICKDIFDFHEISEAEIIAVTNLDAAKQIYIVVQVLYSQGVQQNQMM